MSRVAACGCDCADCLAEPRDHRCECEVLCSTDSPRSQEEQPDSDDLSAVIDDETSDSSYVPHSSPEQDEDEYLCPYHSACVEAADKVEELLAQLLSPRENIDIDERHRELVEHICSFYE